MADQFHRLGFTAEIVPTAGHPLVYAESPRVAGAPTALVYGHYDVQPPEPLEKWISPPFEPVRREGNIVARGATDDKGQVFTHIKSAEAWIKTRGSLPINLKYIIEGEEEVGSKALEQFIAAHADRLSCDCVVISDGGKFSAEIPAITYALRGHRYYELRLTGPNRDLHSGSFGGSVTNPANALTQILAAMIDHRGKVQLPGFYDDVVPLTSRERREMAALPFDEAALFRRDRRRGGHRRRRLHHAGAALGAADLRHLRPVERLPGDRGEDGLAGHGGGQVQLPPGPASRPGQDQPRLRTWLTEVCPPGITWEMDDHHGSPGVLVPLESPYVAAAARAIQQAFGCPPVYTREGGSIPIVGTFYEALKADTLLLGWGQDDDNTHSPNEKFSLADFHRAIKASALLWGELAKIKK